MKKTALMVLALFASILVSSVPADAFRGGGHMGGGHIGASHFGGGHGQFRGGHGHGHFHGHFGASFVVGPWWWGPFPYYSPYPATRAVVQGYDESDASDQYYWIYCSDPSGYYPYVKQCSTPWTKVMPAPAEGPEDEY